MSYWVDLTIVVKKGFGEDKVENAITELKAVRLLDAIETVKKHPDIEWTHKELKALKAGNDTYTLELEERGDWNIYTGSFNRVPSMIQEAINELYEQHEDEGEFAMASIGEDGAVEQYGNYDLLYVPQPKARITSRVLEG